MLRLRWKEQYRFQTKRFFLLVQAVSYVLSAKHFLKYILTDILQAHNKPKPASEQ